MQASACLEHDGKVVSAREGHEAIHRIRLTSVDTTDQKIIEDLLADETGSAP